MSEGTTQSLTVSQRRARELHAQPHPDDPTRRKFGGRQPGAGRPRKPRVSEIVAAAAVEHADEIVAALLAGVTDASNPDRRSRAADRWARLALQDAAFADKTGSTAEPEFEFAQRSRDELEAEAIHVLQRLLDQGVLTISPQVAYPARP